MIRIRFSIATLLALTLACALGSYCAVLLRRLSGAKNAAATTEEELRTELAQQGLKLERLKWASGEALSQSAQRRNAYRLWSIAAASTPEADSLQRYLLAQQPYLTIDKRNKYFGDHLVTLFVCQQVGLGIHYDPQKLEKAIVLDSDGLLAIRIIPASRTSTKLEIVDTDEVLRVVRRDSSTNEIVETFEITTAITQIEQGEKARVRANLPSR